MPFNSRDENDTKWGDPGFGNTEPDWEALMGLLKQAHDFLDARDYFEAAMAAELMIAMVAAFQSHEDWDETAAAITNKSHEWCDYFLGLPTNTSSPELLEILRAAVKNYESCQEPDPPQAGLPNSRTLQ
jgi:hypothetical protein